MITRLDYIDKLRGFAIFLVVVGHLYQEHTIEGNSYPFSQMIYSFHMSLFFFVSGYLCEATHKIDKLGYGTFIKKKAVALLLPYLFWVLVVSFLLTDHPVDSIQDFVMQFNFFPNKLFWFMPVLFLAMLVYAIQYAIISKSDSLKNRLLFICSVCSILSIFGCIVHQYGLLIYSVYMASFLIGALLMYMPRIQTMLLDNKAYMGGGSIMLCILWFFYPFDANGRALYSFLNVVLTYMCSACAIVVLFVFFYKTVLNKYIDSFFSEMGKMSIVIYLTPLSFLPKGFVFEGLTMTSENVVILIIAVIHCLVAYAIGRVVYTIPYLKLIVYGKK